MVGRSLTKHYTSLRGSLLKSLRLLARQEPSMENDCSAVIELLTSETREGVLREANRRRPDTRAVLAYLRDYYIGSPPPEQTRKRVVGYHENPSGPGPTIEELKSRPHISSMLGLTE